MADLTFDIPCDHLPVVTVERHRTVGTDGPLGFARTRRVYEYPRRSVLYEIPLVTGRGTIDSLTALYNESMNGIAPMDFTAPNGEGTFEVVFADANRPFTVRQLGANSYAISVNLIELL